MAGAPMPAGSLGVACPDTPGVTAAEVGSAKTQLEKEEQSLLRMKELFEQQLKVLQAEAVTIQRLIATHSRPQPQQGGLTQPQPRDVEHQTSGGEDQGVSSPDGGEGVSSPDVEPNQNQLPELNLDLEPSTTLSLPDDGELEECDSDE